MKVEQPDSPELKEFVCRGLDAGEWIYVQAPNTGAAAQLYVDSACEPVTTTYWEDVEVTEIKRRVDAPMTWDTAQFTEGSKLAEWQNILRDKVAVITPEWDGEHWLVNLDGVEEEYHRVISLYLEHANRGTWEYGSLQHSFIWTSPPNFLIKYPVIIPERPQIPGIHGREFTQLPDRTWSVKGPIHPDMREDFARGLAKATGGTWNFSTPSDGICGQSILLGRTWSR